MDPTLDSRNIIILSCWNNGIDEIRRVDLYWSSKRAKLIVKYETTVVKSCRFFFQILQNIQPVTGPSSPDEASKVTVIRYLSSFVQPFSVLGKAKYNMHSNLPSPFSLKQVTSTVYQINQEAKDYELASSVQIVYESTNLSMM